MKNYYRRKKDLKKNFTDIHAPLMDEHEMAAYLGCSLSFLRRRRGAGKALDGPPFVVLGNKLIRYPREGADSYIANNLNKGQEN
jgi:hypothetical protein